MNCRVLLPVSSTAINFVHEQRGGVSDFVQRFSELVSTIQEDYGYIIGAESTHWVAFYKDHTIRIYDLEQKQLLQTLTPPAGLRWFGASLCRHPDSQGTAVVTWDSKSLCIYDHDGRHLTTHKLQFTPFNAWYAIACNRRHLYLVSGNPINVTVYSWSGQLVNTLDTQQLGIPEGQWIYNLAVGEDQFTIAVGPGMLNGNGVSSFRTCQCV
jgi:WD40 repeat protein